MKSFPFYFSVLLLVHILSAIPLAQELEHPSGKLISEVLEKNLAGSPCTEDFNNDLELDDIILDYMDANHIPGLAASIVKYGDMIWSKGYGFASFNPDMPATEDTVFMLASVSKPITGTTLMQLYDEGKFDLHDPVNDYLPFAVKHPKYPDTDITFHMLLTHSSGIKDNWNVMKKCPGDPPISLGQYLQDYLCPGGAYYKSKGNFTFWEPGTNFKYSNIGCALAGHLVEAISGMSLEHYCQQNLFLPLGMEETSWFVSNLDPTNMAMPYKWNGYSYIPQGHYNACFYPSSTLRTSASQLSRFLATFIKNRYPLDAIANFRILDSDTAAMMVTPQIPAIDPDMGLFWVQYISPVSGKTNWGHAGSWDGAATNMSFRPEDNTGVIVLCNNTSPSDFLLPVIRMLYDYASRL
ncbi:MAG: serine hydrolase domain-containing protein [Planctomycetota bacterium]|jgi:CubicO group peptidase (beta-lactamase class C family)